MLVQFSFVSHLFSTIYMDQWQRQHSTGSREKDPFFERKRFIFGLKIPHTTSEGIRVLTIVQFQEVKKLCCQLGNNFHFQRFIRTTDSIAKAAEEKTQFPNKTFLIWLIMVNIRVLTHVCFQKKLFHDFILSQKFHKSMYYNTSKHTR